MQDGKNILRLLLLLVCGCAWAQAANEPAALPVRAVVCSAANTLLLVAPQGAQTSELARVSAPAGTIGQYDWQCDASGTVVVVWEDRNSDGSDSNIRAALFDAAGRPCWGTAEGISVNTFRGLQTAPRVAGCVRDGFYVVWQSDSAGGHNLNIWCQRITAAGQVAWSAPAVVCTDPAMQTQPAVAVDPDGVALVAWVDYRHGNADIYGQRIEADGAPLLNEDGVAVELAPGDQTNVRFVGGPAHELAITWDDHRAGFAAPVRVETDVSRLPIPEPASLALLGAAVAGSAWRACLRAGR
jgi:hypothetical protein